MDAELKERARAWLEDVGLYGYIDSEGHVEALTTLLAAILADEERRVWMAVYVREIYDARNESTAIAFADRRLTVWREARAAWEARDGRK